MEEIIRALLDDLGYMTKANQELAAALREIREDSERNIAAYREELHTAKARVETAEARSADFTKRCDRLQEKYDALHEKYDRLVEKSIDKTGGGSRADVKVNL